MSKRQFKSQASSGRAGTGFGGFGGVGFGSGQSSVLSYIQEPLDYTGVSDSNTVVALKNLQKKDATTKSKALEDLETHVASSNAEPEDGLLEAWVKLYPRLSIDSARRVRQLAHVLNGQICSRSGKRTARHLPRIAGPWLAGGYDNDRAAAKAAQDALGVVFHTLEKVNGLRKTFQASILEYCRDAVLHETIQTLSDERTVSPDDAGATYARVVATSLAVIGSLLEVLSEDDISKQQHTYEEILGHARLWDFVCDGDAAVRRSMHKLIQTNLRKQPSLVEKDLKLASSSYIYKGLPSNQTGSALEFMQTLDALTVAFPAVWTDAYSGKKSVSSRLKQLLKNGSQSSSGAFWDLTSDLVCKLPKQVFPTSYDEAAELVNAAKDGAMRKDERFNASSAWPAYFVLVETVAKESTEEDTMKLLNSSVVPLIRQYLQPSPETAEWAMSGGKPASLVAKAALVQGVPALLERECPVLAERITENAKMSQPEQSKAFDRSQLQVAVAGERWADLQRELFAEDGDVPSLLSSAFSAANRQIVAECTKLLKARNGKPYGAAATIEALLRARGSVLLEDADLKATVASFAEHDIPQLMFSSSQRHLVHSLFALSEDALFSPAMNNVIDGILAASEDLTTKVKALRVSFPPSTPKAAIEVARANSELQGYLQSAIASDSSLDVADLLSDLMKLGALQQETTDAALAHLTASLSISDQATAGLSGLELLSKTNEGAIRAFMAKSDESSQQLLPSVLRLEQSADDGIAEKATALSARLSSAMSNAGGDAKFSMVVQDLESVSASSLPIDALHDLTKRLLGPDRKVHDATELLPNLDAWTSALHAASRLPLPSLTILSPLGGAVHLVQSPSGVDASVRCDAEGLSQALRIAMYVSRLLTETELGTRLEDDRSTESSLIAHLFLTVLLAEDNMSISGANALWDPQGGADLEAQVLEFVTEANAVLRQHWSSIVPTLNVEQSSENGTSSRYSCLYSSLRHLSDGQASRSAMSYYVALAFANLNANLFEMHGYNAEQAKASEGIVRTHRSDKNALATASSIVGLQQPLSGTQTMTRFCNELVADLTDLDMSSAEREMQAMERLVFLNTILKTQEEAVGTIAKQRLIFLVKRLIPALSTGTTLAVTAEICKVLSVLLPGMSDMYGEHWAQALSYIISFWTSVEFQPDRPTPVEGQVLLTHASLRLYGTLRKLAEDNEPNDDLVDAMKDNHDQISDSLVRLLKAANGVSDAAHQPLMITHDMLARYTGQLPYRNLADAEELYSLLYTPSRPVHQAAFDLLHRQIPASQEQISLDVALENKTAHLPDELLSLILEAPTLDSLIEASFEGAMPLQLQGYLFSWRLLFDHFEGSSFRVKSDYIEQLKDGMYLAGLLGFAFDFLGHTRGKPVDASKFDIQAYTADAAPSPERDVQWLLTHLYYLALTHLPGLVKSFYLEIRSRQTSLALESWTAKYISPLIVNASLQAVAEWSEKSVKEDPEYEKMSVKVGMRSREINVGYVVDEQTMAIRVILPDAYPLASAQVVGVNRVAVKEDKWQNWLRNCSFQVNSIGSITDGLSTWRRNVTGALQGQQDCAICYSILDSQKSLPTKRCPTCKHLFHSSCLLKWFKTSNASTCPLCRNAFNFN